VEDDILALWKEKMEEACCPNYDVCQLVQTASVVSDPQRRQFYLDAYCLRGNDAWEACKRYAAKNALNFCPDFVLPDSPLSPSEIIDHFDRLSDRDQ
jgi:hypothetical protein